MAGQTHRQGDGGGYPPGYGQGRPGYGRKRPDAYPAASGEPEYYPQGPAGAAGHDDAPGHTRAFRVGESAPQADGGPGYGSHGYDPQGYPPQGYDPQGYGDGGRDGAQGDGYDNVAMYRAGQSAAPPVGPRLPWKELLRGIALRPGHTFWQMRDHTVWGPALVVTFVYGLLAVFGFDSARSDVLHTTLTASIPWVLTTGVAVVLCGLTLGAVTNTLARQLGGDGAWAPTIGLAMLVTSLTDAPRLLFAMFLGGGNSFVELLGWLTWLACAALLTSMVSKSHDLPWVKALGACSIQLIALLMLFKLPLI